MHRARFLIALMICLGLIPLHSARAAQGCGVSKDDNVPSACNQFHFYTADGPYYFQFASYLFPSSEAADGFFPTVIAENRSSDTIAASTSYVFGNSQAAFRHTNTTNQYAFVVFKTKRQVAVWATAGSNIDPFMVLHDILLKMQSGKFSNGPSGRVNSLLPSLDEISTNFVLETEQFAGGVIDVPPIGESAAKGTSPTPTAASNVSATPDLKGTIAALNTQVAEAKAPTISPTSTMVATSTPIPTRTPTAYPTPTLESVFSTFEGSDSVSDCDATGWNFISDGSSFTDAEVNHYAGCTAQGIYILSCAYITNSMIDSFIEPGDNEEWVACKVVFGNGSSSSVTVSPFDFALVDGNNTRYQSSFVPFSNNLADVMQVQSVPSGQNIDNVVAFVIPRPLTAPAYIEIEPMLNFTDEAPVRIVLNPLPPLNP